jgi:hypothetical protein
MDEGYDYTYNQGTMKTPKALDRQVGGDHYKKMKIQPAEYNHANNIGFLEGEAISYISRWKDKNGIPDIRKAIHILEILIELEEAKQKNELEPVPTFINTEIKSGPSYNRKKNRESFGKFVGPM